MSARRDALVAAARLITAVREIAGRREGAVATVGQLQVSPNIGNVIPGEVKLRLDVRHLDDDARDATFREITHQAAVIAEEEEVEFDMLWNQTQLSVKCDPDLANRFEQVVAEVGIQPFRLPSGAGHDAAMMAKRFPTAMLFVRCAGGLSHHPDEAVSEGDVATALDVLLRFVKNLAAKTSATDAKSPVARPAPSSLTPSISMDPIRSLPFGTTRSRVTRNYALITPDTHVNSPFVGWRNASAVVHIAPEMGARFTQYTATLESDAVSASPGLGVERFVFVLDGAVHLKVGGQSEDLGVGQFAFIPPDTLHEFTTDRGANRRPRVWRCSKSVINSAPRPPRACGLATKKISPAMCFRTTRR